MTIFGIVIWIEIYLIYNMFYDELHVYVINIIDW